MVAFSLICLFIRSLVCSLVPRGNYLAYEFFRYFQRPLLPSLRAARLPFMLYVHTSAYAAHSHSLSHSSSSLHLSSHLSSTSQTRIHTSKFEILADRGLTRSLPFASNIPFAALTQF